MEREREESRSQHDRGKPENEISALRAPTSKAFGGMPLHNFTLNIIHISDRVCVCVCVRKRARETVKMGMRKM